MLICLTLYRLGLQKAQDLPAFIQEHGKSTSLPFFPTSSQPYPVVPACKGYSWQRPGDWDLHIKGVHAALFLTEEYSGFLSLPLGWIAVFFLDFWVVVFIFLFSSVVFLLPLFDVHSSQPRCAEHVHLIAPAKMSLAVSAMTASQPSPDCTLSNSRSLFLSLSLPQSRSRSPSLAALSLESLSLPLSLYLQLSLDSLYPSLSVSLYLCLSPSLSPALSNLPTFRFSL